MISRKSAGANVLSVWHAGYLMNAPHDAGIRRRFSRELEIEAVRSSQCPDQVSRLSGFYAFEDADTARHAVEKWDGAFRDEHLVEIELDASARVSRYDAEWISLFLRSRESSWIAKYLSGQPTERPIWELLIEGRGWVLGTGVRQGAYETVKRVWPASLALLELSRVAVELGSDLGFIAPIVTVQDGWADLNLYMDFRDAKNPEFLERLRRYEGPKNTADLNAASELVLPDLREFSVRFQLTIGGAPETTA